MEYRTLGKTGLRLSEIGFAANGGGLLATAQDEQRRAVERAIDLGVNYFEAGGDTSESSLGGFFRHLGVRPFVGTNVEIAAENRADIPSHIESSVKASLDRLQVDYVDVVSVAGPLSSKQPARQKRSNGLSIEDYLRAGGVVDALQRIVRAGKTRFVGLRSRGNDAPSDALLLDTGAFQLLNVVYNILNPTAIVGVPRNPSFDPDFGQVIRYAHGKGIGTVVHNPLAGGSLSEAATGGRRARATSRAGRGAHGDALRDSEGAAAFHFLSVPERHSLAQAAVRFALTDPSVATVLPEFRDIEQLEELSTGASGGPLSEQLMTRIEMVWRAIPLTATPPAAAASAKGARSRPARRSSRDQSTSA